MKKIPITYLLLVLFGIMILGCKKHNTPVPVIPVGMTATTNDTAWAAQYFAAHINNGGASGSVLEIDGIDTSFYNLTRGIFLSIRNYNYKTGTYSLGSTGPNFNGDAVYTYNNTTVEAIGGTVTLYQISATNIQGTFSFFYDSILITNGQFNVPIQ